MSDPVRVLELRSVWGTGGGPDKTILASARVADPARVRTTVCYIRDARDRVFTIDQRAAAAGIDYVEVIERNSYDPRIWGALRRIVRDRRIEIVHGHDQKTDVIAWALARRDGVIPMSTAHGFAGISRNERLLYGIEKRVLASFPLVIAVADHIRDELVRTGSKPDRVVLISNAIDPAVFRRDPGGRDAARRDFGFAPDQFAIGAVGRLEQEKRYDLLVQAVATVQKTHPEVMLAIVGEGTQRPLLESIAASTGAHVRLLGHQSDVIRLHHAFDLFVQSSTREGSPNAVLEAMAMGTPIVATNVGGTGNLITDGVHGLLVPRDDVTAMSEALRVSLDDPAARGRRAVAARQKVEAELSFEHRMRKIETIYERLARPSA